MSKIEGKIAAILSPTKVVINRGSKDGVRVGDYFYIYSEWGPFTDPDTKQNLGSTKRIWGKVEVSIVESRFCIAETATRLINPAFTTSLAILFGSSKEQINLPVHEGQMWKGFEKIEIGFPALFVRREESEPLEDEIEELEAAEPLLLPPVSYRRKKGQDTWHSCSNCSNWPTSDYEVHSEKPAVGEMCNECRAKTAVNKCY
jgi:hypothetical protein